MPPSPFEKSVYRILARALEAARKVPGVKKTLPKPRLEVELSLIDGPRMQELNRSFRGKIYATDVLSFPAPAPIRELGHLGELVICVPVLRKQAREQRHPPRREAAILLVHGLLHLLGFDHEKGPREARAMRALEARWLKELELKAPGLIERAQSGTGKPWPKPAPKRKAALPRTKSARSSRK